jgi:hypothetical protein
MLMFDVGIWQTVCAGSLDVRRRLVWCLSLSYQWLGKSSDIVTCIENCWSLWDIRVDVWRCVSDRLSVPSRLTYDVVSFDVWVSVRLSMPAPWRMSARIDWLTYNSLKKNYQEHGNTIMKGKLISMYVAISQNNFQQLWGCPALPNPYHSLANPIG